MRVLTEIGEQGLELGDKSVVLRPSMFAMTCLGGPERIVEVFAELHKQPALVEHMDFDPEGVRAAGDALSVRLFRRYWREMLFLSWEVLNACADGQDLVPFIGEPGQRYGSYRLGKVPAEAMLAMARSLMQHGCIGKVSSQDKGKSSGGEYSRSFEALQFVSLAVAHLGVTEAEAWNMTMTSFHGHWEAKHGKQQERRYEDEHTATMNWLAAVNAIRDGKKANE